MPSAPFRPLADLRRAGQTTAAPGQCQHGGLWIHCRQGSLDLYSVGLPNDKENRGNFRYTLAKPLALEFKKVYFEAKKRVLAMRPDELCQETVDIGGFTSSKPAVEYPEGQRSRYSSLSIVP